MRNSTWNLENYLKMDDTFSGDEIVNKRIGFNFFACQDCVMTIEGKCRSVVIEACKNMTIYVDSCVSEVSVMNCTNLKIYLKTQVRTCSLESSQQVTIYLNNRTRDCMVVSTCSRGIFVRFPKNGTSDDCTDEEMWKKLPVSEAYESKVEGDELITRAADNLE
jgi:hypothetical protein